MKIKIDKQLFKRKWFLGLLGFATISVTILVFLISYAERKISHLVLGGLGESFSTQVYTSPTIIQDQSVQSLQLFRQRLKRLNYTETPSSTLSPGEYRTETAKISIYLKGFEIPNFRQNALVVNIAIDEEKKWHLHDSNGNGVMEMALEPELAATLSGKEKIRREPTEWEELPPHLINAVVAAEDHRFFHHLGVRPIAIFRAFLHNLKSDGSLHGGSTITQQLAKNLFLTPERTLKRKIVESFLAFYLEFRYPKKRILTLYLNHIYFGQEGYVSIAGVKSASRFTFDKKLEELTLSDAALLAGIIRSPYLYNPAARPDKAKERRDFVLRRMLEEGFITGEELFQAQNIPLSETDHALDKSATNENNYYISEIVRLLLPVYGKDALFRYGLKIYTSIDPLIQKAAYEAVRFTNHQAAVVVLDAYTGKVKALIGGKDYKKSQYNRATQAMRQPGSAFKPFVYGAALEKGITPSSFLQDLQRGYSGKDGEIWTPQNFDGVYRGTVTVRQALANSMNTATLDLVQKISPQAIISFARRLGISSPLEPTLAIGLGVYEVSLLELTAAYAPFSNGGFKISPVFVTSVVDSKNNVIQLDIVEKKSVIDPALSTLITSLLQTVVIEGTARKLKNLGWTSPAAGKTGTTNDGKDAWFIGYTPRYLAGVWVGDDQARPIRASGSKNALPIWANIMKKLAADIPPQAFSQSGGIVRVKICSISGDRAHVGCENTIQEAFISGTAPKKKCSIHEGGLKGWFKQLFR